MAILTFNSNLAALNANRRLTENTAALSKSSERLSSGLRINNAADDAAGLAIADLLRTDVAVSNQAIRNANDAVSLVNIAEGATRELGSILIRIRELGTQSANETLSDSDREPLQEEVDSLVAEYNRIVSSTEFNSLSLIDGNFSATTIQLGYGTADSISLQTGEGLKRNIGTGQFDNSYLPTGADDLESYIIDIDGDGDLDTVGLYSVDREAHVRLNDGSGGVSSLETTGLSVATANSFAVGDVNNDGEYDLIVGDGTKVTFHYGDGEGKFDTLSKTAATPGSAVTEVKSGFDLDGDGLDDVVYLSGGRVNTLLSSASYAGSSPATGSDVALGDFNGDGAVDFVSSSGANGILTIYENDGAGNFSLYATASTGDKGTEIIVGDFDNNGFDDIISIKSGAFQTHRNNGDASFSTSSKDITSAFTFNDGTLSDLDGDGNLDFLYAGSSAFGVRFGIGDGTFDNVVLSTTNSATQTSFAVGDLDGDEVKDLFISNGTSSEYLYGLFDQETTLAAVDISTQAAALESMSQIDRAMDRVSNELGALGATTSRLETAVSELFKARETLSSAESSIRDADVAAESARLIKNQILQETAISVLTQANSLPEIALSLLDI